MNYQTYNPHPDLEAVVKCYWTLEVPAETDASKQRIVPDGCIELVFILGDDIKRYVTESEFVIQPRAVVIGQITEPFYIQPTGYVNTFAVRFYPYGFANFISSPLHELTDKETPIDKLFEVDTANELEQAIIQAADTKERIAIIESFLTQTLNSKSTINTIVKTTIDALEATSGSSPIKAILKNDPTQRRQLERNFSQQIGVSPKQLGKIIRLQTALKMLLRDQPDKLSDIAYESEYYDQAHFIRDFKDFTGVTPTDFIDDKKLLLFNIFYRNE
jgi:hypothetical protein